MSVAFPSRTRAALASLLIAALGLAACDSEEQETNAAANAVELARYLPDDTQFVRTVDIVKAREELDLPEVADAAPASDKFLARPKSPEAQLFEVTANAYPFARDALKSGFKTKGASPLDGSLIRAAAGGLSTKHGRVFIVSTAESLEDIVAKLELTGYSSEGRLYVAGPKTPDAAAPVVADGGSGRILFAEGGDDARMVLRRIAANAEPGTAAEALEPAAGSVRLAVTNEDRRSCVTAFSAAMQATGEGAALALIISGDKPEPDRFDPTALKGLATGTPTVLVDALLVPIRVKRPLRDGLDAISQVTGGSKVTDQRGAFVFPPFESYDCP